VGCYAVAACAACVTSWRAACGGALVRIRTGDLVLTKDALYQLSYEGGRKPEGFGKTERETRLELATFSLEG
jgi:hypothetical protein